MKKLSRSIDRVFWSGIVLLSLVAVVVRLFYMQFTRVDWDGYFYLFYARNMASGNWFLPSPNWTIYPPGYPVLIAILSFLGLTFDTAAVLISQLAGVLMLLILSVWLSRRDRPAAILVSIFLVFDPVLIRYNNAVLSESLFTLLLVLLILYWWPVQQHIAEQHFLSTRGAIGSLCLLLLLSSVRSLGLVLLFPYVLIFGAGGMARKRWATALVALIGAGAIPLLYMEHSRLVKAALASAYGGAQYGISMNQYAQQEIVRALSEYGYTVSKGRGPFLLFLWANRWSLFRMWLQKMASLMNAGPLWAEGTRIQAVFPVWTIPFAILGIQKLYREDKRPIYQWFAVLSIVTTYVLAVPLFTADPRYYAPLVPVFLLLVAKGTANVVRFPKARSTMLGWRAVWRYALVCALIVILAISSYRYVPHDALNAQNPWKEAGQWIRKELNSPVVLSTDPAPAYYAHAQLVLLPSDLDTARLKTRPHKSMPVVIRCAVVDNEPTNSLQYQWLDTNWNLVYRSTTGAFKVCVLVPRR